MKKVFSFCLICLLALSAMAQDQNVNVVVIGGGSSSSSGDYVDLGLPSGTLWKRQNESGYYTYEQAINRFGSKLPERHHFVELEDKCTWISLDEYGYRVVGPNGNSITLPAAGYRDCNGDVHGVGTYGHYWSSTPYAEYAWYFWFSGYTTGDRCLGHSVRLVQ